MCEHLRFVSLTVVLSSTAGFLHHWQHDRLVLFMYKHHLKLIPLKLFVLLCNFRNKLLTILVRSRVSN